MTNENDIWKMFSPFFIFHLHFSLLILFCSASEVPHLGNGPPSTITTSPFMKLLRSLTMKAAYSASSSDVPSGLLKPKSGAFVTNVRGVPAQFGIKYSSGDCVYFDAKVPASRERHFVNPIIAAFEVA